VREVNDREFIERLLEMDAEGAIEHAEANKSACSAGGAVAALSFARGLGARAGTLVRYMTSNEVYPGDSFVGYAAIVFAL
jgi:AmmeMemoRadiSam system protein B